MRFSKFTRVPGSRDDPVLILGVTAGRAGPAVLHTVNLDRHCLSPSGQAVTYLFDGGVKAVPSRLIVAV